MAAEFRAERCHGGFRAEKAVDSRAERCHGAFRAEKRANSRAGGNNFLAGVAILTIKQMDYECKAYRNFWKKKCGKEFPH